MGNSDKMAGAQHFFSDAGITIVGIRWKQQDAAYVPCLIDTGANMSLFDGELAVALGIDIGTLSRTLLGTAGESYVEAYKASVELCLPDTEFREATVAFRALGRNRGYGLLGTPDITALGIKCWFGKESVGTRAPDPAQRLLQEIEQVVSAQQGSWLALQRMVPQLSVNPALWGKTIIVVDCKIAEVLDGPVSAFVLNGKMKDTKDWAYIYLPWREDDAAR
jgi:hypothetical protein